jgi:hypothetical protein
MQSACGHAGGMGQKMAVIRHESRMATLTELKRRA